MASPETTILKEQNLNIKTQMKHKKNDCKNNFYEDDRSR